ncbi:MAG: formate hydrogenlyase maturation HycH family protein [Eggerthellaceae bacterium]|nr:formate hydrogenlyase maturation HycH family protein [Eggerthellaceae bacterium]
MMSGRTSEMRPTASIPPAMRVGEGGESVCFDRSSGGHTTDARYAREVVFYRLGAKFVDNERSIPEDVRSVLYYTLAIGHHTGVIDCLEPRIGCSRAVFAQVLEALGTGEAAEKLGGVERFGEIQLDKEHVPALSAAVSAALEREGRAADSAEGSTCGAAAAERELRSEASQPSLRSRSASASTGAAAVAEGDRVAAPRPYVYAADAFSWLEEFAVLLDEVASEPQVYAMGRRVTP